MRLPRKTTKTRAIERRRESIQLAITQLSDSHHP
jgi:hypothetical protein